VKIFINAIIIGSLFSPLGMTNGMAAAGLFFPWRWSIWWENDDIYSVGEDLREYFFAIKGLYERGEISRLDFAKMAVCVFRHQATEERGLVDILCKQCGIPVDGETRIKLVVHCLCDPSLRNTPILVLNIPENFINAVDASKDLCTNPHPDFCRAVMAAKNIPKIAKIFNQFSKGFKTNPKIVAKQSEFYAKAKVFREDISRSELKLMIGKREISVPRGIFRDFVRDARDIFQVFLDYLKKSEADGGAGLDEANAFYVLKQVALAYRGQNGTGDGFCLISLPLSGTTRTNLFIKFNGSKIGMKFENQDGRFILVEKTENSPILGIKNVSHNWIITSESRFKFPGDSEIRTQLPVTSKRILSADGTIRWSCPFRENPPQKVIFYGDCRPANAQ
jgi:hypothetical protein